MLLEAVNESVSIYRRIIFVTSDVVMNETRRVGPIPFGNDQVALYPLRPRWGRRHLTGLNAIAPLRKNVQLFGCHLTYLASWKFAGFGPCLLSFAGRFEFAELLGNFTRCFVADLFNEYGPLNGIEHVLLSVEPTHWKRAFRRNLQHGEPIVRRIILSGGNRGGRNNCG